MKDWAVATYYDNHQPWVFMISGKTLIEGIVRAMRTDSFMGRTWSGCIYAYCLDAFVELGIAWSKDLFEGIGVFEDPDNVFLYSKNQKVFNACVRHAVKHFLVCLDQEEAWGSDMVGVSELVSKTFTTLRNEDVYEVLVKELNEHFGPDDN